MSYAEIGIDHGLNKAVTLRSRVCSTVDAIGKDSPDFESY